MGDVRRRKERWKKGLWGRKGERVIEKKGTRINEDKREETGDEDMGKGERRHETKKGSKRCIKERKREIEER